MTKSIMHKKTSPKKGLVANSLTWGVAAVKLHLPQYRYDFTTISSSSVKCSRGECLSCGCSIVKSKAIGSTWSRFTPTEPNWTDEPAVINYGDIQHLSGMEPKKRGVYFVFKKLKEG